jgi:hypothetical protein
LTETITLGGLPPWKILACRDHAGGSHQAIKTLFLREMLSRGVLINASHNVTAAFTAADVELVLSAWQDSLAIVHHELERGGLDRRLGNSMIRPPLQARAAS